MGLEGLVNGGPEVIVRGIELAYSPADMNINATVLSGGGTIFSNWANLRGTRNCTLWVQMTVTAGAPIINFTAHWVAEDNLTNLGTDVLLAGFAAGATWTPIDFGMGSATVPSRVFGQMYIDATETAGAGNDCTLIARLFARF